MDFFIKVIFVILIIILACILVNYFRKLIIGGSWGLNYIERNQSVIRGKIIILTEAIENYKSMVENTNLQEKIIVNLDKKNIKSDIDFNNVLASKLSKLSLIKEDILFIDPNIFFFSAVKNITPIMLSIFSAPLFVSAHRVFKKINDYLNDAYEISNLTSFNIYHTIFNILLDKINQLFILDILVILNILINLNISYLSSNLSETIYEKNISCLYVLFIYFSDSSYDTLMALGSKKQKIFENLLNTGWETITLSFNEYIADLDKLIKTNANMLKYIDELYRYHSKRTIEGIEKKELILPDRKNIKPQNKLPSKSSSAKRVRFNTENEIKTLNESFENKMDLEE